MNKRICQSCCEEYPLTSSYFHKDTHGLDGYRVICKKCYNKRSKELRAANKQLNKKITNDCQSEINNGHLKICRKCQNILPANQTYFDYDKRGKFELRGSCRMCENKIYDKFDISGIINRSDIKVDKFGISNIYINNILHISIADFYKNVLNKSSNVQTKTLLKYECKLYLFDDQWERDFFISINNLKEFVKDRLLKNNDYISNDVIDCFFKDNEDIKRILEVKIKKSKSKVSKKQRRELKQDSDFILNKYIENKDELAILYYCLKYKIDYNSYNFISERCLNILNKVSNIDDLSSSDVKLLFDLYLKYENIDDIFNTRFENFFFTLGIRHVLKLRYGNRSINFALEYTNFKYPVYKFYTSGLAYESKTHRIRDFKYFIEKDLRIDVWRIPFELTSSIIQKNTKLGHVFRKYYNCNMFNLINDCYPNIFNESDFKIKDKLSDFDSKEELHIDKILRIHFDNVIYNTRHRHNTVNIDGKIPDWIIMDKNKPIIVEYFGLWNDKTKNKRCKEYTKRAKIKIREYENLIAYDKIYLFPNDLTNGFEGVYDKISKYKSALKFYMQQAQ